MLIPRFWQKLSRDISIPGLETRREVWGWSLTSVEDARRCAKDALDRIAGNLRDGTFDLDSYGYATTPAREQIIREFGDASNPAAIITRNAYGCLVLNTRDLVFVDVDCPSDDRSGGSFLGSLFGRRESKPDPNQEVLERIRGWTQQRPHFRCRVYRTAAGFRVLISNAELPPSSNEAESVLDELGSDPLYRRLCRVQECYRARLTPKPWRIRRGSSPPTRFPWQDDGSEQLFADWLTSYEENSQPYRTCEFVEETGEQHSVPEEIKALIELHDEMTQAYAQEKELA